MSYSMNCTMADDITSRLLADVTMTMVTLTAESTSKSWMTSHHKTMTSRLQLTSPWYGSATWTYGTGSV